jgi:hypothetical protein
MWAERARSRDRQTIHAWSAWRGEGRKGSGAWAGAPCMIAGVDGAPTGWGGVTGAVL